MVKDRKTLVKRNTLGPRQLWSMGSQLPALARGQQGEPGKGSRGENVIPDGWAFGPLPSLPQISRTLHFAPLIIPTTDTTTVNLRNKILLVLSVFCFLMVTRGKSKYALSLLTSSLTNCLLIGRIILGKTSTFYMSLMDIQLFKYLQANNKGKLESEKPCNQSKRRQEK